MKFLARLTNDGFSLGRVWAITRTLVASAPLLTLLTNDPQTIYPYSSNLFERGQCSRFWGSLLPCLIEEGSYGLQTHVVMIVLFAFVTSGCLPVLSGPLHVYLSLSYMHTLGTTDGGEQAALVYSVWALPICLVDWRATHWHHFGGGRVENKSRPLWLTLRQSTINVFILTLKLQISLIYLTACLSKLSINEWANGTAFYYWTVEGYLPPPSIFAQIVIWASESPVFVLIATYGTLLLEFFLGISLLIQNHTALKILWICALFFHFMIGVVFAIWSFSLVMCALVTLLLARKMDKFMWFKYSMRTEGNK